MAKRNIGVPNVALPANPTYIEFERSDGDVRTWSSLHQSLHMEPDGQENWMLPVPIDHPTALKWRLEVGRHIAIDKAYEDPSKVVLKDWPKGYKMFDHHKGFPDKVRHDIYLYGSTAKRFRSIKEFVPHAIWLLRDVSLDPKNCACKYCSKRSQKEISYTLQRFAASPSRTPAPSAGPSSQSKVDLYSTLQQDALKAHKAQERSLTSRAPRREPQPKAVRDTATKSYAAVQKMLRPVFSPSANVLNNAMLAERNDDLRAIYSSSANKKEGRGVPQINGQLKEDTGSRRWYRCGEVVWVKLPGRGIAIPQVGVEEDKHPRIEFWPALVETWSLKVKPGPLTAQPNGANPLPSSTDSQPLWNVKQSYHYRVHLLSGNVKLDVSDSHVLPYLVRPVAPTLMEAIESLPLDKLDFDRTVIAKFQPSRMAAESDVKGKGKAPAQSVDQDQEPQTFYQAAAAFTLASQIAESIGTFWGVTDRYEFLYRPWGSDAKGKSTKTSRQPLPSISTAPRPSQGTSLATPIQVSGQNSAASLSQTTGVSVDYNTHHDVSKLNPDATLLETNQAAVAALGIVNASPSSGGTPVVGSISARPSGSSQPSSVNGTSASAPPRPPAVSTLSRSQDEPEAAVQVRYQGIWWGPERLWEDDFIRLKVARGALAPSGSRNVLKPSGPGKNNRGLWETAERVRAKQVQVLKMSGAIPQSEAYAQAEDILRQLPAKREDLGAVTRGTFMRVGAFSSVDVLKDGRVRKEMRARGMLYELADFDYEEGDDDDLDGKGKGQAIPQFEAKVNELLLPQPGKAPSTSSAGAKNDTPTPPVVSAPPLYLHPQPPHRFKFRPILAPGYEAVISLSLIAGRYYPRICCHPLIAQPLQEALDAGANRDEFQQYWALEGLWPGSHNSTNPEEYRKYRAAMVEDSDNIATGDLQVYVNQRMQVEEEHLQDSLFGDDVAMGDGSSLGDLELADPDQGSMDVD